MPLMSSTEPNPDSMVGFRVSEYMINGQFWFMQELGLLNASIPFPSSVVARRWLRGQCGENCNPRDAIVIVSSLLTPSLTLADSTATLSMGVGVTVRGFPDNTPKEVAEAQLNMSVAVSPSIQPGANGTQQLVLEINFDDVRMDLGSLNFLQLVVRRFLRETLNKNATLPSTLDATGLYVQDGFIQVNSDISLAGMISDISFAGMISEETASAP